MSIWTGTLITGSRVTFVTLLLSCLLLAISCSTSTRQLFFDVDPPSAEELAEKARQDQLRREGTLTLLENNNQQADKKSLAFGKYDENLPRPDIESLKSWDEVLETLPKDYKKKADWAAAVEQGLVRPRSGADPMTQYTAAFRYDFIIAAENPKNEGYFPHSAHTAWLGCKNCHMTLYAYKRNPASMKEMRGGASCGACHGKVAFSLKQCKRCHLNR